MSDDTDDRDAGTPSASEGAPDTPSERASSRRRLMLGAAAASAVVTIRPALAGPMASVAACQVPVPDPKLGTNKWIDPQGLVVDAGTPGAFRPPSRPLTGAQIQQALQGANFPGADFATSRAYLAYIRKLQSGMSGFTCYQSMQMPNG
jgi:hypothetical protein